MNLKVYLFEGTSKEVNSSFKTFIKNQSFLSYNPAEKKEINFKKTKETSNCKAWAVPLKRSSRSLNSKQATIVARYLHKTNQISFFKLFEHVKKVMPKNTPSNVALSNYLIANNYVKKNIKNNDNSKTTYWVKYG